jgi:hypothetical protein
MHRDARSIGVCAVAAFALLAAAVPAWAFSKKKALDLFYTKTESDARFAQQSSVYSKGEVDGFLADVYTKTQADGLFAQSADVYTKTEADGTFAASSDVYTKAESDAAYATSVWATVGANGSLIRGNHTLAGTSKTGTGAYEVKFDRNVTACAKAVTLYGATFGQVTVLDNGDSSKVSVFTANSAGAAADLAFHLIVIC